MRKTLGIIGAVALLAPLSACGNESAYCSAVSSTQDAIDFTFTQLNQEQFDDLQSRIDDIEKSAPADVKDDWAKVGDAYAGLEGILSEAGITVDDFVAMERGAVPAGFDRRAEAALNDRLSAFTSDHDVQTSIQAIRDSAQQECDVRIGN
jgi:hypothetical protein